MARNCEKKLIGLNRMYIKEQQEEERIQNPKRPSLHSLHSAPEVKKWIPSIKKELDYCLEQLSGARQHQYPDRKISEFEEKVAFLEKEYKRFINKVLQLDPTATGIPWQPRGYVSKRKASEMKDSHAEQQPTGKCSGKKKICTPLVDHEIKECAVAKTIPQEQAKADDSKSEHRVERLLNLDYESSSGED